MRNLNIFLSFTLAFLLFSCSGDDKVTDALTPDGTGAPIVNRPTGALKGEILVKLKSGVHPALNGGINKTASAIAVRSGIASMDRVLQEISTHKIERIFPVDNSVEMRTRETGLDRWYVVEFDENTNIESVAHRFAALAEVAKVQYSHSIRRNYDHKKRPTSIRSTNAVKSVAFADAPFNDPHFGAQWGLKNDGSLAGVTTSKFGEPTILGKQGADVAAQEAWSLCTGDASIIVAVLDEGVMWNHPDLKANMWVNEAEVYGSKEDADGNGYAGDRYGFNFVTNKGVITYDNADDSGHGTHVAGIIAAVNNNGEGISSIAGGNGQPNSGVKIMACQVFSGAAGISLYQEAKAVKYAADNGAVVLQCSWGYNSGLASALEYYPGYTSDQAWIDDAPLEKEALDYFVHNAGSPNGVIDGGIIVFAAGNEYSPMAGYPGAHPDYISVASLAADGTPASYSNFGHGTSIAAPGGDGDYHKCAEGKILSTLPPLDGDLYGYMEGTSMACPMVSGVVALGLSYASQLQKHFKAADFRQLVINSVSEASLESYFTDTKLYYMGYEAYGSVSPMQMAPQTYRGKMGSGFVNAYKLLKSIEGAGVELRVPNVLVAIEGTSAINFARYFKNGKTLTFSCSVADQGVVTASSTDHVNFIFKGLKNGSSKATVTASNGEKQEFIITVRKGNGWL